MLGIPLVSTHTSYPQAALAIAQARILFPAREPRSDTLAKAQFLPPVRSHAQTHTANTTMRLCLQHAQVKSIGLPWSPLVSLGLHTRKKWETTWVGDRLSWRWHRCKPALRPHLTQQALPYTPRFTENRNPPLLRAACIVWYALTAKCMHAILQRYLGLPWQQPPEQQPPDLWDALGIAANAVGRALATAVMQLLGASVVLQERACEHVFGVGTVDVAEQLGDAAYLTVLLIIFRRHCSKAPATLPSANWVSFSWLPRCVHHMHT